MASSDPANQSALASSPHDRAPNPAAPAAVHLGFLVSQPSGRLPSYKLQSSRYHPYRRPEESPPPRYEDCMLYHTIYDDEGSILLGVPERPPRTAEEEAEDRKKLQKLVEHYQRIRRLVNAAVMPEFFAGLRRAVQDGSA